jgi:rubrerythrin
MVSQLCTKLSQEQADSRLHRISGGTRKFIEPYQGMGGKAAVQCLVCNHIWKPFSGHILRENGPSGCPKCSGLIKITSQEADARLHQNSNGTMKFLEPFKNSYTKIAILCLVCGHTWRTRAQQVLDKLNPSGCQKCFGNLRLTHDEAQAKLDRISNGTKKFLESYISKSNKILVQCLVCDYKWSPFAGHVLKEKNPTKCPKCSKRTRATQEEADERLCENSKGRLKFLEPYTGTEQRILTQCLVCNHSWRPLAAHLLKWNNNSGCPKCAIPGFRFDKPGTLYYVRIPNVFGDPLYKIGITNKTIRERFRKDSIKIDVIETWHFENGAEAYEMEQDILKDYDAHRWTGPDVLESGNDELFIRDVLGLDKGQGQIELLNVKPGNLVLKRVRGESKALTASSQ